MASESAAGGAVRAASESRGVRRVLVVDDERSVAELIRDVLRRSGIEVALSSGGEEALAEAVAGRYDLVISDFAIPGMNGLEFAARLRALEPTTRVLIVSAFLDPETTEAIEKEPAVVGTLRKPFDIFHLMKVVESRLREVGAAGTTSAGAAGRAPEEARAAEAGTAS